jgi:hypothetical protein
MNHVIDEILDLVMCFILLNCWIFQPIWQPAKLDNWLLGKCAELGLRMEQFPEFTWDTARYAIKRGHLRSAWFFMNQAYTMQSALRMRLES